MLHVIFACSQEYNFSQSTGLVEFQAPNPHSFQNILLISIKYHSCGALPIGYKTVSCQTQLSMKCIVVINVKMSTIVGSSTFISMAFTASESLKARKVLLF